MSDSSRTPRNALRRLCGHRASWSDGQPLLSDSGSTQGHSGWSPRTRGSHPGLMSEHTTHIPEIRRLERSRSDRMLAGVSGGLARYFEIHPAVFRVGFVVLTLLGGAGILIYAAAALVMPDEGKEDSIATAALRNRRDRPWPLIGLGLLAVAGAILLSRATLWPDGDSWCAVPARGCPDPLDHAAARRRDPAHGREGARGRGLAPRAPRRLRAASASSSHRSSRSCSSPPRSSWPCSTCTSAAASATAPTSPATHAGAARRLPARDRLARARPQRAAAPAGRDARRRRSVDVGDLQVIVPAGVALRAHGEVAGGQRRDPRHRRTTAATPTST